MIFTKLWRPARISALIALTTLNQGCDDSAVPVAAPQADAATNAGSDASTGKDAAASPGGDASAGLDSAGLDGAGLDGAGLDGAGADGPAAAPHWSYEGEEGPAHWGDI